MPWARTSWITLFANAKVTNMRCCTLRGALANPDTSYSEREQEICQIMLQTVIASRSASVSLTLFHVLTGQYIHMFPHVLYTASELLLPLLVIGKPLDSQLVERFEMSRILA